MYEKCLLHCSEMQNKTTMRNISSKSDLRLTKNKKNMSDEDTQKRRVSHTIGGDRAWYNHYGKQYEG